MSKQYGNYFIVYKESKVPKAMKRATKEMLKTMKKLKLSPFDVEDMQVWCKSYSGTIDERSVAWKFTTKRSDSE